MKLLYCLGIIAFAIFITAGLSGCRYSDTLVEILYDQSADEIDYDNPTKIYKLAQDTENQSPDFPETSIEDTETQDQPEQIIPNSTNGNDTDLPVERIVPGSTMSQIPAGNASTPYAANTQSIGRNSGGNIAGTGDGQTSMSGSGSGETTAQGGTGQNTNVNNNIENNNVETPDATPTEPPEPETDNGPGKLGQLFDARNGQHIEIEQCSTLVAASDLSAIVAMLGGADTLAGTSEDFITNEGAAKLSLQSSAISVFSGNGQDAGTADIQAIIDLQPDGVLISNDSAAFSEDDQNALLEAGINVILLPSMKSATSMTQIVDILGSFIVDENGSNTSAQSQADAYLSFYDDIISTAQRTHGGGWANGKFYDINANGSATTSSRTKYSLYIAAWDDDASVTATAYGQTFFTDTGAAYTNGLYDWSPLCTFMSAGGVVNNAADYIWANDLVPVLQYNESMVSYTWQNFDIATGANGGSGLGGPGTTGNASVLTNSKDGTVMLGDRDFPAVVVRTQEVAQELSEAIDESNGLYTPCTSINGTIGRLFNGEIVHGYTRNDIMGNYSIYVNPAGFMGSWADGGAESVLESVWVASKFYNLDESTVADKVTEFYNTFYGYQLSAAEVQDILNGSYATSFN